MRFASACLAGLVVLTASFPRLGAAGPAGLAPAALSADAKRATILTRELVADPTRLATAVARRQVLLTLIDGDPGMVLRLALPASARGAASAQVRAQLEDDVQVEGRLEILHEDTPGAGRFRYVLQAAGARYSLHFAGGEPRHLLSGARIRVRGVRLDQQIALAGGSRTVQTVSAAPTPTPLGEQRTLVVLVNFQDNPAQPWSRDQVTQAILGTLDAFIRENSYGAAWVTGDVTGWLTIALSSAVCDVTTLASQATQAAAAGWVPADYPRWIFAFPRNACSFGGASLIGGAPSQAWLNGSIALRVAGHEYGHGLGLWHSHSIDCGEVTLGPVCTTSEYGDTLDVMGTAESAHFDAFHKERLGWLTPLVVTESGSHTLGAYEVAGTPAALKILRSVDATGTRTWYHVEARKPIGFDATLTYGGMTSGVVVLLGSESSGDTSYMLDMTPNSGPNDRLDPALVAGATFSDPDAGVAITTDAVTTTSATVTVRLASGSPTPPLPTSLTAALVTARPSYTRTQTVSVTATVTSAGSPVSGASVVFTITKASGTVLVANAITGSDGTAVYRLRLKKQDPVGTYRADVVARQGALSATATTQRGPVDRPSARRDRRGRRPDRHAVSARPLRSSRPPEPRPWRGRPAAAAGSRTARASGRRPAGTASLPGTARRLERS